MVGWNCCHSSSSLTTPLITRHFTRLRIFSCLAGEPRCYQSMSFSAFPLIMHLSRVKITPAVPLRIFKLRTWYEIARRNLQERAEKQVKSNENKAFPSFQPGDQALLHRPCTAADGPNPQLISPWRGPYVVCSRLSPVIYRVSKGGKPEEMSVHLARIKRYYAPSTRSAPDFDALDDIFLGTKIPVPDFGNVQSQVRIKNLVVNNAIEIHRRSIGKPSPTNFQYLFTFRDYPSSQGAWCHVNAVPQCFQLITA